MPTKCSDSGSDSGSGSGSGATASARQLQLQLDTASSYTHTILNIKNRPAGLTNLPPGKVDRESGCGSNGSNQPGDASALHKLS